jgi:hypothetical protein
LSDNSGHRNFPWSAVNTTPRLTCTWNPLADGTTSHPNTTILSTDPYQEQFGYSVAMMGKTIAIGDPGEDAVNGGAAYVLQMQ